VAFGGAWLMRAEILGFLAGQQPEFQTIAKASAVLWPFDPVPAIAAPYITL